MGIVGSVGPVLRNVAINHALALGFGVVGFVIARVAKIIFTRGLVSLKIAENASWSQPAAAIGAGFTGFQTCLTVGRITKLHRNPGFMPNPRILALHVLVTALTHFLTDNRRIRDIVLLGAWLSAGSIYFSPVFIGGMGAALGASDIPVSRFIDSNPLIAIKGIVR
jgi:hypothetical protein